VEAEIDKAEAVIQNISGVNPKPYFRPPFGAWDSRLLEVLGGRGYDAIYWTVDSGDWKADATTEAITAKVVNNAQNGAIIVFHVAGEYTLEALPSILDQLSAKGYAAGTLTQALAP